MTVWIGTKVLVRSLYGYWNFLNVTFNINLQAVLVRSLYGYWNIFYICLITNLFSSCTLAIWVLKLIIIEEKFLVKRFLYARYMGIETLFQKHSVVSEKFLYARYMGIETWQRQILSIFVVVLVRSLYGYWNHSYSYYISSFNSSCTLAIWVLKLSSYSAQVAHYNSSCTLAIWVLKPFLI